jgi:hypothetical protein
MKKTIHRLRQRPQKDKERIAFFGAIVITALIVMFYLAGVSALNEPQDNQLANPSKPFDNLKTQLSDTLKTVKSIGN